MKFFSVRLSTQEVQQVLQGKKTQIRQLMKPQPERAVFPISYNIDQRKPESHHHQYVVAPVTQDHVNQWWATMNSKGNTIPIRSPYGDWGDVLWVRESFLDAEDYPCAEYHEDPESEPRWTYRANCPHDQLSVYLWQPSTRMPREACRLFLEVTDRWPERIHSLGLDSIAGEGLGIQGASMKEWKEFWEKKHGVESWRSNPWVWAASFKIVDKPANF